MITQYNQNVQVVYLDIIGGIGASGGTQDFFSGVSFSLEIS
jgi:hypothetical protein